MKTLTWNVNQAGESRSGLWRTLHGEDPDIAMLQEVRKIPDWIRTRYNCYSEGQTVVLSKWEIVEKPYLTSEFKWVNRIRSECVERILECEVIDGEGARYRVVSVLLPHFRIPEEALTGVDVSSLKLKNNPHVWFTEILWSLLRNAGIADDANWIVSGDFNSSVKFDSPKDRGNREVVERMHAAGLTDCLSHFHGEPVPTFRHSRGFIEHQIDYCYVNAPLLDRLTEARVLSREAVFGPTPKLSDHLPILCEFR